MCDKNEGTCAFGGAPDEQSDALFNLRTSRNQVYLFVANRLPPIKSIIAAHIKNCYKLVPVAVFWCGRRDLNPHGCPQEPETCASANFATSAKQKNYSVYFKLCQAIPCVFLCVMIKFSCINL